MDGGGGGGCFKAVIVDGNGLSRPRSAKRILLMTREIMHY